MRPIMAGIVSIATFALHDAALAHDSNGGGHGAQAALMAEGANLIIVELSEDGPQTIRIAQGAEITVQFNAPDLGELHLHGYDILAQPDENGLTMITLIADTTGRFAVVTHAAQDLLGREEKAVAYIEVLPE